MLSIDKFKNEDGTYTCENGCRHDNAESFYTSALFHFCGCGRPKEVIIYIRDCLRILTLQDDYNNDKEEFKSYNVRYQKACKKVFNSEGAKYFMWQSLDKLELTEHGGSVPGWLTEKGRSVLSDLQEILK